MNGSEQEQVINLLRLLGAATVIQLAGLTGLKPQTIGAMLKFKTYCKADSQFGFHLEKVRVMQLTKANGGQRWIWLWKVVPAPAKPSTVKK